MNNINNLLIISLVFIQGLKSQNSADAYRYSDARALGTARVLGTNGSFGAIGADQTAIGINAAGLGLFRKSDVSFGLSVFNNTGNFTLDGNSNNISSTESRSKFNLSNLGIVISRSPKTSANWINHNIYIGYTKTASYAQNLSYSGLSNGSILHRFLENSTDPKTGKGYSPDNLDDFETKLAYETGALYDISTDSSLVIYANDLLSHLSQQVPKNGYYEQKGYQGNFSIAYGANYKEKLLFGISLDFPSGKYAIDKVHGEDAGGNSLNPFYALKFSESVTSEYNGIKANLGIIFKPINSLRLGLAYHTPTVLSFKDSYSTGMIYQYLEMNSVKEYTSNSPDGVFDYRLITASKWIGSAALVTKFGFINIDVDYLSPNKNRFSFSDATEKAYETEINNDIKKQYKSIIQTRVGIEVPIKKLRLRTGFGLLPSPYSNDSKTYSSFGAGIGYRNSKYYVDFGMNITKLNSAYVPFRTGNTDFNNDGKPDAVSSIIQTKDKLTNLNLTLGTKF